MKDKMTKDNIIKFMKSRGFMLKDLKQQVGKRFREFRSTKAQHELAAELNVHQSTITNIEHGTTFPKINYLEYFFQKYGLDMNWMITGEGEMLRKTHPAAPLSTASQIGLPQVQYGDARFNQYKELYNLMQIPVVEQVIFAKLMECKIMFRDDVNSFLSRQEKEKRAKVKKAEMAKVKK